MKPHSERCRDESTRDVIFLLQVKRIFILEYPNDDDSRAMSNREFARKFPEHCLCVWESNGVWLTREEATDYAKAHEYNYPDGWQVYGTYANGKLAELLKGT